MSGEQECADMLRQAFAADDIDWIGDVTSSLALTLAERDKCCGNADWRGHLCQFHQGIEQGLDLAVEILLNRTLAAHIDGLAGGRRAPGGNRGPAGAAGGDPKSSESLAPITPQPSKKPTHSDGS